VSDVSKRIVIIAGPNGAGKTTFAREFLPNEGDCLNFVNADLIAAGLSPFAPELAAFKAGRLMLKEIAAHVKRGDSFAFETTLSGLTYARMITVWRLSSFWSCGIPTNLRCPLVPKTPSLSLPLSPGHWGMIFPMTSRTTIWARTLRAPS
jgi:hypothetical protein